MAAPRVTTIIPTYNCDRYLCQAVDSVLSQTGIDGEIIVVDDGSTDSTDKVVQSYRNKIRYVYQENQGVSMARNHGIQLARGEFVAFLDADDYFLPGKLAAQVARFQAQPDLGIVHSGWRRVDPQGKYLMDVRPWEDVPQLNLETWVQWKPVLPSAMMFRRQWLEKVGGFDPRFPPAEDTEMVLRLALQGCPGSWLRRVTVCYRQHEGSAMFKGLPQARSLAAAIDNFFQLPEIPERLRLIENRVRHDTLVWIAWYLYYTGHKTEMVEYLQQACNYSCVPPVERIISWVESFTEFSRNWGSELDGDALGNCSEWQQLVNWLRKACRSLKPTKM